MPPLRKVKPGDPLDVPAAAFNTFIDAAEDYQARQRRTNQSELRTRPPDLNVILVENASGSDRDRFDVLGLGDPVISPTDNLLSFQNGAALAGAVPALDEHEGRFGIALEPIPAGAFGPAAVAGVVAARISVSDETHTNADVADGDASQLASGASGIARILWIEAGTGTKWALAAIGGSSGAASPIWTARVSQVARDGDNWRWTYQVGEVGKATAGYGGWDSGGGRTGWAFNEAEDISGVSGELGNGVLTTNLDSLNGATGTMEPKPIPTSSIVTVKTVLLPDGTEEYWIIGRPNAIDGLC